jgi:hypothetical protein
MLPVIPDPRNQAPEARHQSLEARIRNDDQLMIVQEQIQRAKSALSAVARSVRPQSGPYHLTRWSTSGIGNRSATFVTLYCVLERVQVFRSGKG